MDSWEGMDRLNKRATEETGTDRERKKREREEKRNNKVRERIF